MGQQGASLPTPDDVSRALSGWLERTYGGPVSSASPPRALGDGFDCLVHAMQFAGPSLPAEWRAPVVARLPPAAARSAMLERETQLQTWSVEHGITAPRPLLVLAAGEVLDLPVQVSQQVPGVSLMARMTGRPWRIPRLLRRFAQLQVGLHRVPVPEWADPIDPAWALVERRLALVRHVTADYDVPEVAAGLAAVNEIIPLLQVEQPAVCHGDFHPLNVLVDGDRQWLLDWTDAGIGDRHGDVARTLLLFEVAAIAAPRTRERLLIASVANGLSTNYLRSYRRWLDLDVRRLQLWRPVHLLQLWTQIVTDRKELFGPRQEGARYRAGLEAVLRQKFVAALSAARSVS